MSLGYPFSAFVVGVVTSTYLTLKTGAVIGKRSDLFSFPRPNDVKYEKNYHQDLQDRMHGVEFKSELKQISTIRSQYNDAIYMAKNFVESIFGSEGAAKAPDSLPQRIVSPREVPTHQLVNEIARRLQK